MFKICSISQASSASKKKAKSSLGIHITMKFLKEIFSFVFFFKYSLDLLQPYRTRPQTTTLTANRRICAALGVKNPMSNDKRQTERQKIETARRKSIGIYLFVLKNRSIYASRIFTKKSL